MEPLFSEKQLQDMSKENIITLIQAMQTYQKKQETEIQLLKEKTKELEFMNALLSDRLALAQRKQFGSSSEKYAEGYEQMDLFNEAEPEADPTRLSRRQSQYCLTAFYASSVSGSGFLRLLSGLSPFLQ